MNDEIREILDNPKILQLSYGNYVSLDDYNELKFVYENDVQEIKALAETMKYKEMDFCKLHDEVENYKSIVEKAIEDIEFCFRSIKQEADMSKDERTRHEMRTCLAIFNETLKSLKNGSDNNG